MMTEYDGTEYDSAPDEADALRQPVHTPYIRRDSTHNPEYLDPERLLARFAPLIQSVQRQMQPCFGRYQNVQDAEDLRALIELEFLRLHERYDPSYGVDFPGYIKLYLERRVYYYVSRRNRSDDKEVLTFGSNVTNNYMESMPDHTAESDLQRVERIVSVPRDGFEDEFVRDIIEQILDHGADLDELADRYGITPRSMSMKIDAVGRYVRTRMMEREDGKKEGTDAGTDAGANTGHDDAGRDSSR